MNWHQRKNPIAIKKSSNQSNCVRSQHPPPSPQVALAICVFAFKIRVVANRFSNFGQMTSPWTMHKFLFDFICMCVGFRAKTDEYSTRFIVNLTERQKHSVARPYGSHFSPETIRWCVFYFTMRIINLATVQSFPQQKQNKKKQTIWNVETFGWNRKYMACLVY